MQQATLFPDTEYKSTRYILATDYVGRRIAIKKNEHYRNTLYALLDFSENPFELEEISSQDSDLLVRGFVIITPVETTETQIIPVNKLAPKGKWYQRYQIERF